MRFAQQAFDKDAPKLIEDAAQYLSARLVEEVLNGQSGRTYPKGYPPSITPGSTGFVGVVTSNLRRSIGDEKVDKFTAQIRQINSTLAPYHDDILNWSEQKYGKNFYRIAVELYGPGVAREIEAFLRRLMKDVDNLNRTAYRNPFPG